MIPIRSSSVSYNFAHRSLFLTDLRFLGFLFSVRRFLFAMVVTLRRNRRTGRFARAGSSNPLPRGSASPVEALPTPALRDSFALAAVMNPDNVHSPLFLHHADHPGLQIVSVQLDGSNYTQWCSAMKIAFDAKNKIAFVDGSLPRPAATDPPATHLVSL